MVLRRILTPMLKLDALALELLEYKVDDLRLKRVPKGGGLSVWPLHEHLSSKLELFSSEEQQRFKAASQLLKRVGVAPVQPVVSQFEELELTLPSVTESQEQTSFLRSTPDMSEAELGEQKILKRLAKRVWWFELGQVVQRLAAGFRAEKERHTARLLYALTRNLQRYSQTASYAEDINLSHFKISEPVPELSDPLISLTEIDTIAELLLGFVELILNFHQTGSDTGKLELREDQTLVYLRRMALTIVRDPYAGKLTMVPGKGPGSKQLRLALDELQRERLSEEEREAQRRELEFRLEEARTLERTQRQLFEADMQAFAQAADRLFEQLAVYLPERVGGQANEPRLPGGVLFAVNPALTLETIPPRATSLTVRVKGPLRFKFAGSDVAIMGAAGALSLYTPDEERPLLSKMEVRLGRKRMFVFNEGTYVHLQLEDEMRSLAALLAEALALHYIVTAAAPDKLLNIIRTATGAPAGEAQETLRRATQRLRQLVVKSPDRREAVYGFMLGSAKALRYGLPENVVKELAERLSLVLTVSSAELEPMLARTEAVEKNLYQLGVEPLSLKVAGHPLTVRQYRSRTQEQPDNVVVMLPGRPLGSFTDYLVQPLGGGTLICVKAATDLAVLYLSAKDEKQGSGIRR